MTGATGSDVVCGNVHGVAHSTTQRADRQCPWMGCLQLVRPRPSYPPWQPSCGVAGPSGVTGSTAWRARPAVRTRASASASAATSPASLDTQPVGEGRPRGDEPWRCRTWQRDRRHRPCRRARRLPRRRSRLPQGGCDDRCVGTLRRRWRWPQQKHVSGGQVRRT